MAGHRRHLVLLGGLLLLIAGCILLSLSLSSRVADLDGEADGVEPDKLQLRADAPTELTTETPKLELRSLDLVDLIECGKTFAFTRVRLEASVPATTPVYRQRPVYLHQKLNSNRPPNIESGGEIQLALLNPREVHPKLANEPQHLATSELPNSGATVAATSPNPLAISLDTSPGTTTSLVRLGEPENVLRPVNPQHDLDPVDLAASEMQLSLQSFNRTLTDCFFVDTAKRHGQKVALEDEYRLVASTRRVSFKQMMATIVECRHLTWATLPTILQSHQDPMLGLASSPGADTKVEAPLVKDLVVAARSDRAQEALSTEQPTGDLMSSLLSGWFRLANTVDQHEAESRARPVLAQIGPEPEGPDGAERRQSYLNLGLSMVSGIVPNTLWCGLGDRAANYSELGPEAKVDSCCRSHDHCPIRLKPFATDYGLINWSVSTRSHCDCDLDFNDCLLQLNTTLSNVIRTLYFRFVGLQCIDVEGRRAGGGQAL